MPGIGAQSCEDVCRTQVGTASCLEAILTMTVAF